MDTSGSGERGGVLGGALPEKRFHAPFSLDFSIPKPRSLSCRNPLKARFRFSSIVTLFLLFAYLLGCAWMFFAWALPEAQGIGQIRLGADSATYYAIAKAIENGKMAMVLLSFTQNLIGPISVILLLKNAYLITLFDLVLFLAALRVAATIKDVRFDVFALWVMIDVETMSALTTVNKEIFALLSVVLFAKYLETRSNILLVLVLISALMARWEQVGIVFMFLALQKIFRRRPAAALVSLAALMTIVAPIAYRHVDPATYKGYIEGGRTMLVLDAIQSHFGYWLVVIPKAAMNLMGDVAAPWTYFSLWANGFTDAQNQILIREHEVAMTCLMVWALLRRKVTLRSEIILFIGVYLIVTSVNMFVQSRYDYPVFVLLALEVAKKRTDVTSFRLRPLRPPLVQQIRPEGGVS